MKGGIYSPEVWNDLVPANVLGGINRAKTAKRDLVGRFLPNDGIGAEIPQNHGVKGGKVRASSATRNKKGQFVCANT